MDISKLLSSFDVAAKQSKCRIISVYISGSYANDYSLNGISDLDLLLLVDNPPKDFLDKVLEAAGPQDVELDLCILAVSDLYEHPDSIAVRESVLSSKLCGLLIYGEDLLKDWQIPPMEEYTQRTVEMVFMFIRRAHGDDCDMMQLQYPDASDPYMGYSVMRNGKPSTKQLISLYTWIATARLADRNGIYCGCKKQCINQSLQHLDADFSEVLGEVYANCREKWGYKIPDNPQEQIVLAKYCKALLKYEQDFANQYYDRIRKTDPE